MVGLVQKHSEEMIIEPSVGGSSQANNLTRFGISHASTVMPRPKSKVRVLTADFSEPSPTRFAWPADTNLLFSRGTCKLSLNIQQPRIRDIIRDACDNVQAQLLCRHAFPDAGLELSFVKDSIFAAAHAHGPAAASICERLVHDEFYMSEIMSLPRARILSFRSKVKEHCRAIVAEAILAMSSRSEVAGFVEKQLSRFNYIFQTPNANGLGHGRRSRPYQNGRIIRVIRELYFARRRRSSLAACFNLFPKTQGDDGAITYEVPVPMVALVATGLYAALSEWRNGDRKRANFSTNACSKVYQAHIRNFNYIRKRRERGFHSMMAEIYTKSSCPFGLGPDGNPIRHILPFNIDDLPE
ncbi:hypothetical protein BC827DRAFT_1234822 [Russula dissimulans]|nr:hypothetical protein BC827DRAFT_1234822 [Russula dissimulans]